MNKLKKYLASLMVVVIMFTATPLSEFIGIKLPNLFNLFASAATSEGTCGENLTWSFDSETGVLTISGTGAMQKYFNMSGQTSAPWANLAITSVVIEKGVTTIGEYAFYYCQNIESVSIPDTVTSISSYAFYFCYSLKSVTIPGSVKTIGDDAFSTCHNLESLTLCNGVETIGYYAFMDCSFSSIIIPPSVKSIASGAFSSNDELAEITLPDGIKDINNYAFGGTAYYKDISNWENGLLYLDGYLLCAEDVNESVTIKDGTKFIASDTFYYCYNLKSITIPDSVEFIGPNAFDDNLTDVYYTGDLKDWCSVEFCGSSSNPTYYAENLYINNSLVTGELVIPDGVTSVGKYAFYNLNSITSVTIPESVKSFGEYAFSGCENISNVYYLGNFADWCQFNFESGANPCNYSRKLYIDDKLVAGDIVIPDGVTSIGSYAFHGLNQINSITIPEGVVSIGDYAFKNCGNLTSLIIPLSVTSIGEGILDFIDNGELIIYYPGNMVQWDAISIAPEFNYLESHLILECNSSKPYYMPGKCGDNLDYIIYTDGELVITGSGAMYDYKDYYDVPWRYNSVKSVYLSADITYIGDYAFDSFSYSFSQEGAIYYPGTIEQWNQIEIGYCEIDITDYLILDSDSQRPYYYPGKCGDNLTYIVYTDGELVISGTGDMYDFVAGVPTNRPWGNNVKSVTIEKGVTNIGEAAFYTCSNIESVTIPDTVTSIGVFAFDGCKSLKSLVIPDSVKTIAPYAFYGCSNLTDVTLPDGIEVIPERAFGSCGFTTITIPESVTTIGQQAFLGCKNLENITIPQGVKSIGNVAFGHCGNLVEIIFTNSGPISLGELLLEYSPNAMICCEENSWLHSYADVNDIRICILDDNGVPSFEIKNDILVSYRGESSQVFISTGFKIGYGAFENNQKVETIVISSSINRVYNSAFKNCLSLKTVVIPTSVTSIGADAFDGCDDITIWCYAGSYADSYATSHNINVKYISLDIEKDVVILNIDQSASLAVSLNTPFADDTGIVWESKNPSIATVDENGNIKGIKAGTTVIVATTKDGGLGDYCVVKVAGVESLSSVRIDHHNSVITGLSSNTTSLDELVVITDSSCNLNYSTLGTDSVVYVERDNEIVDAYTVLIYGDVNGDGWYDSQDAAIVSDLANGTLTKDDVSETVYSAADCNHDGVVDALDVAILNQAGELLAKVDTSKPAEELEQDSAYIEYINLIDQSPEIDNGDTDIPTSVSISELMNLILSIISFIKNLISTIFNVNVI